MKMRKVNDVFKHNEKHICEKNLQMFEFHPTKNNVRFFGRIESGIDSEAIFFNWTCSGFEFEFIGTQAWAEIFTGKWRNGKVASENNRAVIGIWIDSDKKMSAKVELSEETKWICLADKLELGRHTIKVIKLSEVGYGRAAVKKLKVKSISLPKPTIAVTRKIEFIGDSITCGYGNESKTITNEFSTSEENGCETFAYYIGNLFNAQIHCICASGNGVFHDYGMNRINLIPELYKYTDKLLSLHYGKIPSEWDFNLFRPDLIIVKIGANDGRYCQGFDRPEDERTIELVENRKNQFIEEYIKFIHQIREFNPESKILYFYDSDTYLKSEIKEAVFKYVDETEDKNVIITSVQSKLPEEGVGANGHWSISTHRRVANQLYPLITDLMNW